MAACPALIALGDLGTDTVLIASICRKSQCKFTLLNKIITTIAKQTPCKSYADQLLLTLILSLFLLQFQ